MKLINGAMYKRYKGIWWKFILVFIVSENKYSMLNLGRHEDKSLSCPMFWADKDRKYCFTKEELKKNWDSDKWVMIKGRLTFEERDECWTGEYKKFEEIKGD